MLSVVFFVSNLSRIPQSLHCNSQHFRLYQLNPGSLDLKGSDWTCASFFNRFEEPVSMIYLNKNNFNFSTIE